MTFTQFADEPDQEERIAKLRQELERLGGNAIARINAGRHGGRVPAASLEYENAEPTTLFRLLENSGLDIPPPDQLDDDAVTIKLKEIVERMALGAYLLHTDHLTDRELYVYLFADGLREEAVLFPEAELRRMIDLTGSGSDADNQII